MNLDQAIEFYENNIKTLVEAANGERELDPEMWSTFEKIAMDCFAILEDNIDKLFDYKGDPANEFFIERWESYKSNQHLTGNAFSWDAFKTKTSPIVIDNVKFLEIPVKRGGRRQEWSYVYEKSYFTVDQTTKYISDYTINNHNLEKLFFIIEKYTNWYESLKSKIGSWTQRNFPTFRGMLGMRENKKPYINNVLNENLEIRGFYSNTPQNLLEWHRDKEDRVIIVQEGSGWSLQKDNSLPLKLKPGMFYQIPAGMYHRLLREERSSDLLLIIEKKKRKKKGKDQNSDGKNDFDDVRIARMLKSGMSKEEIKKKYPDLFEAKEKIKCPKCGTINDKGVDKCTNCGYPTSSKGWKPA